MLYDHRFAKADQLADLYKSFIKEYPIVSIEDGFDQDDWDGWVSFTANTDIQVIIIITLLWN